MRRHVISMGPEEEAQFRKDVRAVLEGDGGALTEKEILRRVRHREIQRTVNGMVEDGLLVEVKKGSYFLTQKGFQWGARAR